MEVVQWQTFAEGVSVIAPTPQEQGLYGSEDRHCSQPWFASPVGDQVAGMLAVAVASSRTLEVLDLEGTGLTNQSAQVRKFVTFTASQHSKGHRS